jgi:hypothetical protein
MQADKKTGAGGSLIVLGSAPSLKGNRPAHPHRKRSSWGTRCTRCRYNAEFTAHESAGMRTVLGSHNRLYMLLNLTG